MDHEQLFLLERLECPCISGSWPQLLELASLSNFPSLPRLRLS